MLCSEELEGHVGVCDDRASLLSDCFVDHSGTLDVAGLSFAYSEDGGDALDAVDEARCVVCRLAAAAEGFLYGLVDNLCKLCYGEVNDSGVLIYHVFRCLLGPRRRSRTARPLHRSVFAVTRARLLLQRPGLGGACAPLCFVFVLLRVSRRWLIMDDPESVAGNSSGSFEELFRSFGGRSGTRTHVLRVAAGCLSFRPSSLGGGQGPAGQTNIFNLSQNSRVSPCTRVFCICRRSIRLR